MSGAEIFKEVGERGHEQIIFFHYPECGLKAIVAIHSTALGPSLGGCRMRQYSSETEALNDVVRLAEGMSYKNSVAGLDLGGGKSCIIADPFMQKGRKELFLKFGECLNDLNGRYISAEDMGTSVADVMTMKERSPHVSGTALEDGGGGDPSPWTARGVYQGIVAACERRFGDKDLSKRHISIQGAGHVGFYLAELLVKAGARLTVSDVNSANAERCRKELGVSVVAPDDIYSVDCDVYSPCAIGQTVNQQTIQRLKCQIIAGAANNQLIDASVYSLIESRNILYCPDFVINAGGVINCASESRKEGWDEEWTRQKVDRIYQTIHEVLERSEKEKLFPEQVALQIARERIRSARPRGS